jgi:hypothetical protein
MIRSVPPKANAAVRSTQARAMLRRAALNANAAMRSTQAV